MRAHLFTSTILAAGLLLTACANPENDYADEPDDSMSGSEWSYTGQTGPQSWAMLSTEFEICESGREQSPINIASDTATDAELLALEFAYGEDTFALEDTGFGLKATVNGTHSLRIGPDTYNLLQFHAHAPSEHTIDGEHSPAEIHFVHANEQGELAVVGAMMESGDVNEAYAQFVSALESGDTSAILVEDVRTLLPAATEYFTYPGSLTTPPCTQGVRWIVLKESISLSDEQLSALVEAHSDTNRPVQDLQDRVVRTSN